MQSRTTIYIAMFLLMAGMSLNAQATLPDSRQYIIQLDQDAHHPAVRDGAMDGSALIMVSPAGNTIQFTATLTNSTANCQLVLYTTAESGEIRIIATLNPTLFKIKRHGYAGSKVHLSGTLSVCDLEGQLQNGSLEEFYKLLRSDNIYLSVDAASANPSGFTG